MATSGPVTMMKVFTEIVIGRQLLEKISKADLSSKNYFQERLSHRCFLGSKIRLSKKTTRR